MFFSSPSRKNLTLDLQAAVNVSLLAIPQGMAYALVAGLPLHYGLLGSALAALLGGLAGKTHFITLGPTNATSVLLFAVFANLGLIQQSGLISETGLDLLPWIILFAGAFLVAASLLRISYMIQFISRTVITAYVTAAAFLIIASQLRHILGLSFIEGSTPSSFIELLAFLWNSLGNLS